MKKLESQFVYLDHAATTSVDKRVKKTMDPFYTTNFGNPSSLYASGLFSKRAIDKSRKIVADFFHTNSYNIYFTGGGTESINMAIFGVVKKHAKSGKHLITSKIEHEAVLSSMKRLEKEDFEVTYLDVDVDGFVSLNDLKKAIRPDTVLISVMYANNEIGTVEPIAEIGRLILKHRKDNNTIYPIFHTDACQATNYLDMDVEKLHVDLMSTNGSKIYAAKGVGVLFKRKEIKIEPLFYGGGQESGLRSGTEDVPAIVGLGKALEIITEEREAEIKRLVGLRQYFWDKLQEKIAKIRLNGPCLDDLKTRLPNNLNVTFLDIEGEALLLYLDAVNIMCSTGSACTSLSLDPSHVLTACGLPYEYSHGSLRFTLGKENNKKQIDYVMEHLPRIVEKLRKISPVNLAYDPNKNNHPKIHQR